MVRFRVQDFRELETAPTSPAAMRAKLGEVVFNSTVCRAKIEGINPETGEYRIVLQGTLDKEESKFER